MVILQNATYIHPNKDILFQDLNLVINAHEKLALIGNNGTGKSTLLQIIAGQLPLYSGQLSCASTPYYIPQLQDRYAHMRIAEVLAVDQKLKAFHDILEGKMSEENLDILQEDWTIEDRCNQALAKWNLDGISLDQRMDELSGGEKTKVFLAGISIHEPQLILMDEPSNHLDYQSRKLLYQFIQDCKQTLLIVSHDRTLLNIMPEIAEISRSGIVKYGGNYSFYAEQKGIAQEALDHDVKSKEKELRKAREKEREANERQQKLNARGKKKQEKAGIPKIMMGNLKNKAEGSTSKLNAVHQEKITGIRQDLQSLRANLPEIDQMKLGFENAKLYQGKLLLEAKQLNLEVNGQDLWKEDLSFQIKYGDRIAISGANGSGKTSLIQLLLGTRIPSKGQIVRADFNAVFVDQDYSLVKSELSLYEMAQTFNRTGLQEHEIKIRLNRFLFPKESWDKSCMALSGGERMRLLLCCLNISSQAPDIMVLDEPSNNIDIQNTHILTAAIQDFKGCLLVVSHDPYFMEEIGINQFINLD